MGELKASNEHCVKIHLRMSGSGFGSAEERDLIYKFSDLLAEAIMMKRVGEFDGDEFGGGQCLLYMYGPDADHLFDAIEPMLRDWPVLKGGYVIKRFGPPGSRAETVSFD